MAALALPQSLWSESKIHMPPCVVDAWRAELRTQGLYEDACSAYIHDKELFGGPSADDAKVHFSQRFKTSSARVQFVLLDPNGIFETISTDLLTALFDGSVSILDAPCGSGAGLFGLLGAVTELRLQAYLPKLPLQLQVTAADISPEARAIHESMLSRLAIPLNSVGIRADWQHVPWDVTNPLSTAELMDKWFSASRDCEEFIVFISAFSGFAATHTDAVLEAARDISKRLYNKTFVIAWIEPISNQSRKVLPKVRQAIWRLLGWQTENQSADPQEEFEYVHPFTGEVIKGRARVLPFRKLAR